MKWRIEQIVNGVAVGASQDFESYEAAEKYLNEFFERMGREFDDLKIVEVNPTISNEQLAALTFGTIVLGMGLAYLIGKECAFQIASNNVTKNLNAVLAQMPAESAKEFVRALKNVM